MSPDMFVQSAQPTTPLRDRSLKRDMSAIHGGLAPWRQRIVRIYIEEHLAEQVRLKTLSRLVRLSTHYFCRAFRHSFGVPPHRYHAGRRIERAKEMLIDELRSVTEIAMAVGFRETSSFTRAFRKATGVTPSRYRSQG